MIKFSLIIPVYNKETVLPTTLETVIKNHNINNDEFECILVNESSTDNSEKICSDYSEKYSYIKYYNIVNDGIRKPSNARNFGKKVATGKYVMFLDADDLLCPGFMAVAATFLDNHPECDFYICNRFINDEYYTHLEQNFVAFGPSLSSCIFRKYIVDSIDFENIINEDIVYTEKVLLAGYKYYYDIHNLPSYKYILTNCEMVQTDITYVKQYKNWICGPAEILQFGSKYKYCISDNKDLITKDDKAISNIDVLLTYNCNLHCKYCSSFCPVVKDTSNVSVDYVVNELKNIQRFRDNIKTITFLGGEPTLHPQLDVILTLARKMFPNNEIKIVTNGTTYKHLHNLSKSIIQNNVICCVSLYPVEDMDEIVRVHKQMIPAFNLELNYNPSKQGFYQDNLQEQTHNELKKIEICDKKLYCTRLDGNKLYMCHYAADLRALKESYKNENIKISEEGSFIELTENTTINDILNFKKTAPDICHHCANVLLYNDENARRWYYEPWSKSSKQLSEFYKK